LEIWQFSFPQFGKNAGYKHDRLFPAKKFIDWKQPGATLAVLILIFPSGIGAVHFQAKEQQLICFSEPEKLKFKQPLRFLMSMGFKNT
jgi:hypothetical protein